MTAGGYGRQVPSDSASDFNAMAFLVRQIVETINGAMVVQVKACTNSGGVAAFGFVDVLPLVNQIDGAGLSTPHVKLYHLPYFRLQGGYNAIICDPEVGDLGIAIIADKDISAVKQSQAQANPGSRRRFSLSDGIYIGGILNKVPQQWIEFVTGSGIIMTDINGNVVNMNSNGVDITAPRLTCTGEIIGKFGLGNRNIHLTTHTHSQPPDTASDGEAETNSPTTGS